ncbi:MAG TPA: LacI family DNA-binding transcriptional regulator [Longimicrobiaceae bacterium]|nr:LacI family DNA-binding transcriptional regulator [Longimicrobiaceae bacterium]
MITIRDVARLASVSPATVSRFFQQPHLLSAETRRRVEHAIDRLGYVPNAVAQTLTNRRSKQAALLVPDIASPFYTTLISGVESVANARGYTLFLANTGESLAKEKEILRAMVAYRVAGVVLVPAAGEDHLFDVLERHDIPVVLVDREIPGAGLDVVTGDSYEGGRKLTEHLVSRGYRDIVFVGGKPDLTSLTHRLDAYRAVMQRHGLSPAAHLGSFTVASGEELTAAMLDRGERPEAIFAASHLVAVGVLRALRARGLRVPDDVAVVCMDNEAATLVDPFLTVAAQPTAEIGRVAMDLLLRRIQSPELPPERVVLPVEMIIRSSCGTRRESAPLARWAQLRAERSAG